MFNFFKKKEKEPHFDPTNITVRDLGKGYIFDYNTESYTVTAVFEYDWGDNFFTREFLVTNGNTESFLHLEDNGGLEVTLSEKIKLRQLGDEVCDFIDAKNKPPKKIIYNGIKYYLDEKCPGYCKEIDSENWEALVSYNYLDADEVLTLCIDQYDDEEFEVSCGKIITEHAISNILPVKENY